MNIRKQDLPSQSTRQMLETLQRLAAKTLERSGAWVITPSSGRTASQC